MFPLVAEAIGKVLPLESLRYIGFAHVEADEMGSLNQFLAAAPRAVAVASQTAVMVSVNDLADRPARALADGEVLRTWAGTPCAGWTPRTCRTAGRTAS